MTKRFSYLAITLMMLSSLRLHASEPDSTIHNVPIVMNGADWSQVSMKLGGDLLKPLTIVHIGDSHLQADLPTSHLRRSFQKRFGNAGRGLVTPFKMSGSYQAADYTINGTGTWKGAKFLRYPWTPSMSFAGTALDPDASQGTLTVSLEPSNDTQSDFCDIQIFHSGSFNVVGVKDNQGNEVEFNIDKQPGKWTKLALDRAISKADITFEGADDQFVFHAINLTNGKPGVVYHTIGNGGADMHMYNLMNGLGEGVSMLSPDLIILALGTNDSYNHFSKERFFKNLDCIVSDLRNNNPGVPILLVTPMEIQYPKTTVVKKKVKDKRGRVRTVNRKSKKREVVEGCAIIHDMMNNYACENGLAIYDWYEATGGKGASKVWVDKGLMRSDHIHLTSSGYSLHAKMMYDSLCRALGLDD